jgi:hypothetical protein
MWGIAPQVPAPARGVKPASTPSVTLLAALGNPSKATRRAIAAVHLWETSALTQRSAANFEDAGSTYTAVFARLSPADRGRVARNELTLAQIVAGERLAALYRNDAEPSPAPALACCPSGIDDDKLDAQLSAIGRERVLAWLDRITSPTLPTAEEILEQESRALQAAE